MLVIYFIVIITYNNARFKKNIQTNGIFMKNKSFEVSKPPSDEGGGFAVGKDGRREGV